jgi:DNA-binding transcriptional regulator GbsR (MarR family)
MTDLLHRPLRGVSLYNPHLHGKDELISLFVVRQELLRLLLDDLRATASGKTPQHHLILGHRGMGKTMLLRRLSFAVEEDAVLGPGWVPLTFPEEQYNIASLSDFWLNCTDALSDWLETHGRGAEAEELDERTESLRRLAEERRAREALALLAGTARRIGRRLVLLVDNVDLVFERIKDQEWILREVLSSEPSIVLVGASAKAVESSFTYDQAFYDFFQIHELEGLSLEETRRLLIHYSEIWGPPEVKRIAEEEPARIQVLHTLTGGNPRTVILLFSVLASGVDGDVRTDLERLLDQCTPLYKARFEELAAQAQQVVHTLAVHWDPISAGELAELLAMDVNTVSSQLNRLVKQGVVEKVEYYPESKAGFQIAERFFNIWYLMRASRRVRRRLVWLVEFLRMFYSQDELRTRAAAHIQSGISLEADVRLRYAEYSFALADALQDSIWSSSLEKTGLHAILRDNVLRRQLPELIDLEASEPSLKQRTELRQSLEQARPNVVFTHIDLPDWSGEHFWQKLENSLVFSLELKVRIAEIFSAFSAEQIANIRSSLDGEAVLLNARYKSSRVIEVLAKAIQTGLMTDPMDVEGAAQAELVLDAPGLKAVALANLLVSTKDRELLSILEQELDRNNWFFPWAVWLEFSHTFGKWPSKDKLPKFFQKIIEFASEGISQGDDHSLAWYNLGLTLFKEAVRSGKAREILEILKETGAAERWWPFREALEAVARGSESYLRRVAPEVRQAASEIFKQLTGEVSKQVEAPSTGRRRRLAKRV